MKCAVLVFALITSSVWANASSNDKRLNTPQPRASSQLAPVASAPASANIQGEIVRRSEDSKANSIDEKMLAATERAANANVWLAAIAIAQAALFLWQLRIMKSSLGDAATAAKAAKASADAAMVTADSYRTAERALISVQSPAADRFTNGFLDPGGARFNGYLLSLRWFNAGKTAAVKCNLYSRMAIGPEPGVPRFVRNEPVGEMATATVAAGMTMRGDDFVITDDQVTALRERRMRCFLYGRADYFDMFAEDMPRHFEGCFEATVNGDVTDAQGREVARFEFAAVGPQNTSS
jgi:hypothetical protein